MSREAGLPELLPLLKRVSRAFYLSIRVLPDPVRRPVALAYLLARAADTIADTAAVSPDERLKSLLAFRRILAAGDYRGEQVRILESMADHQADRRGTRSSERDSGCAVHSRPPGRG